jgi:stage III sporulation protein AH
MPNEVFKSEEIQEEKETPNDSVSTSKVNSQNVSYIETLKIELDSERAEILNTLQSVLNDKDKTSEEKNEAYEEMKEINNNKSIEDAINKKIKAEYSLNSYAKIDGNKVEIVAEGENHDVKLANKIMKTVQSQFDKHMSISVKFS